MQNIEKCTVHILCQVQDIENRTVNVLCEVQNIGNVEKVIVDVLCQVQILHRHDKSTSQTFQLNKNKST